MTTTLHSVALGTDVLPPHATTHGFLFFDLNHEFDAIRYSKLYIPDLAFMEDNKALFFFEIDLSAARLEIVCFLVWSSDSLCALCVLTQ